VWCRFAALSPFFTQRPIDHARLTKIAERLWKRRSTPTAADDVFVTYVLNNTGGCDVELWDGKPGGGANSILTAAGKHQSSLTLPVKVGDILTPFIKCVGDQGKKCTGTLRLVPSRKKRKAKELDVTKLDVTKDLQIVGAVDRCDRILDITEHKNDTEKDQLASVEIVNTGTCDSFIVRLDGVEIGNATIKKGRRFVSSELSKIKSKKTAKFDATCDGKVKPKVECKGEVTIVLRSP
jgi:hypothetical protein